MVGPSAEWKYDPKQLFFSDDFGNINNYLVIPAAEPSTPTTDDRTRPAEGAASAPEDVRDATAAAAHATAMQPPLGLPTDIGSPVPPRLPIVRSRTEPESTGAGRTSLPTSGSSPQLRPTSPAGLRHSMSMLGLQSR